MVETGAYRHFKGNLYWAFGVARHSETEEPLVIYRALYGEGGLWARPLAMFQADVDRGKYPQATQKKRFEKIPDDAQEVMAVRTLHPKWFAL